MKVLHFGFRCPPSTSSCRSVTGRTTFAFVFLPFSLQLTLYVEYLYISPLAWPRPRAIKPHYLSLTNCVLSFSPDCLTANRAAVPSFVLVVSRFLSLQDSSYTRYDFLLHVLDFTGLQPLFYFLHPFELASARRVQVQYMVPSVVLGRLCAIENMTNDEDN